MARPDDSAHLEKEALHKLKLLAGVLVIAFVFPMLPLPYNEVFNSWTYQIYVTIAIIVVGLGIRNYMGNTITAEAMTSVVGPLVAAFVLYETRSSLVWKDERFRSKQVAAATAYTVLLSFTVLFALHKLGIDTSFAHDHVTSAPSS